MSNLVLLGVYKTNQANQKREFQKWECFSVLTGEVVGVKKVRGKVAGCAISLWRIVEIMGISYEEEAHMLPL